MKTQIRALKKENGEITNDQFSKATELNKYFHSECVEDNDTSNIESDNIESDNIESDNIDSDNIESDNIDTDNIESDNIESDNLTANLLETVIITQKDVETTLRALDKSKSVGYDLVHSHVLKECSKSISHSFYLVFKKSIETGTLPDMWKMANVTPLFKKGSKLKASNYRPVSLTSIP